jgi:hypothetical protein
VIAASFVAAEGEATSTPLGALRALLEHHDAQCYGIDICHAAQNAREVLRKSQETETSHAERRLL